MDLVRYRFREPQACTSGYTLSDLEPTATVLAQLYVLRPSHWLASSVA